jgi:hypothetical protein
MHNHAHARTRRDSSIVMRRLLIHAIAVSFAVIALPTGATAGCRTTTALPFSSVIQAVYIKLPSSAAYPNSVNVQFRFDLQPQHAIVSGQPCQNKDGLTFWGGSIVCSPSPQAFQNTNIGSAYACFVNSTTFQWTVKYEENYNTTFVYSAKRITTQATVSIGSYYTSPFPDHYTILPQYQDQWINITGSVVPTSCETCE